MTRLNFLGSLRTKLLVIPIVALLIVFSISAVLISKRVQQALLHNENRQIAQNSKMLSELYNNQIQGMTDTMKMTVVQQALYDGYFGALAEDFDFLQEFLSQTKELAAVDDVLVTGKDKKVMLRAAANENGDIVPYPDLLEPMMNHAPITDKKTQLDGVVFTRLINGGDTIKLVSIGPVLDVETIVGSVVFEKALNTDFLTKQKPYFDKNVEITIATQNKILATTLPGFALPRVLNPGKDIFDLSVNNRPFRHMFTSLKGGETFIGLSYDVSENKNARLLIQRLLAGIILLSLGIIICIIMSIVNRVVGRIKNLTLMLKDIAEGEGDLTLRLEVKSRDEVGELAKWFNRFVDKLQKMISDISEKAEHLSASSIDLSELSGQMSSGVTGMSEKSNSVSASAGEMSSNMDSVAAAVGQASTNVGIVAKAAEEMAATIGEIARNSDKASNIAGKAVAEAKSASDNVYELGTAAKEIDKVTEAITEISEQTNLLALNATIEAARAGEAGKGFAVVANEIKELARQTAEATGEIKKKIDGIQNSTEGTVRQIGQISIIINDVNEIVSTIATAVEEQSVTTKEIAGNVNQASRGIQEVNEKAAGSSVVSAEIAKDISNVNQTAGEMADSSSQMDTSAAKLSNMADQLKEMVGRFRV